MTQSKLLIKQVIGRLILDTAAAGCPFEVTGEEGRWQVTVERMPDGVAFDIRRNLDDLNVFYFEEQPDRTPSLQKYWLYGTQPPAFMADAAAGRLTLTFDRKVPYSNELK